MVTSHFTVPDYLALAMNLYGKLVGSVDTIICDLSLHLNSYTHGLPLKLDLGNKGLFHYGLDLMMHTFLDRVHITEECSYPV